MRKENSTQIKIQNTDEEFPLHDNSGTFVEIQKKYT